MRPWEAFTASGGRSVMASHNSVNGVSMHTNKQLLTDVLRNEFNWQQGLIASDCADIIRLWAVAEPWSTKTGLLGVIISIKKISIIYPFLSG